ncbi:response regulator [Sphingomonas parva]|uniref:response regulator n=1 Tax=Sphingomonas parva TaxID=2555898 RepID=UPI001430B649|nr:response regulator [Sphingomonas parva]
MDERVYIIDGAGRSGVALSFTLSAAGFDPLFYPRLSLFLAHATETPPACILVDVDGPGDGGLETLYGLRAGGISWPVIAVSATDDPGVAARALSAGADDFVAAPFAAGDLVQVIRSAASLLESAR